MFVRVLVLLSCIVFSCSAFAATKSAEEKWAKRALQGTKDTSKFHQHKLNTTALLALYAEALSERQSVLAENVANTNTPGFKTKDMDISKLTSNKSPVVKLKITNPGHIKGYKPEHKVPVFKTGGELKPNGNDVNIADQMSKVAQNQDRYNEAIRNYMVTTNLVSGALGQGNN